ncbi:hypothetical protein G647_04028 [Cladophialophora carrionii CBS 160.54]|uniref:FAD-binding FR-type domain-containing protein n=1 Tax=Cladophialophora carrionii CBS 160.54 TaxID=1279043 RepID=V9DCN0_9EURO|nr:uncharacterized protein G647_04028 [Cladophialophora carrionii CBS 160.54]ETI24659.1 hypothetical protein G647_04028 [Cladophialophora carrionii CBS 160.54]
MRVLTILLALSVLSSASVDKYTGCLGGIQTAISSLNFNVTDPSDYYGNGCTNELLVNSMWAAAKVYCTAEQIVAGSELFDGYCTEYGGVELVSYSEVLPILTNSYIRSLPVAEYSDLENFTLFNTPVLISRSLYKTSRDTYVIFDVEYVLHERYGWAVYGFWGGLLLIGTINRIATHFFHSRRLRARTDVEGSQSSDSPRSRSGLTGAASAVHHWLRAHIIIPAAFGSHHTRPLLWSTIPTRMETIIVVAFWVMTFILCCVSYYIFSPNLYYTEPQQAWRYISDRTGIICYATLPWLWMFAGRNNIFLWLTGWSFATFNIFHRHIARCATVLAIVHSVGWSVLEANLGYFAESWTEQYWYMGGMATVAMSLIVLFSFMWFRVRSYELFLLIHIALSVITLVGLFYHTRIFEGEYDGYLWPPVAIWCFDRAVRLVRWAYCNVHVKRSSSIVGTKATASYDKDANLIRLEVVPGSRMLKPGPGQHYFLYQPLRLKGWENHPFTLGAYEKIGDCDALGTAGSPNEYKATEQPSRTKEIQVRTTSPSSSTSSDVSPAPSQLEVSTFQDAVGQQKLTFFIRPFSSWTRRLREECLKSPKGTITPSMFIEGPYGERSPLNAFETVVFIVGGTGIAGALPYILEHIRTTGHAKMSTREGRLATRTRNITLVWSAKQSAMIRNIAAHELKPILGHGDIHVHLHATSSAEMHSSSDVKRKEMAIADMDLKTTTATNSTNDELAISYGRPDIRQTILDLVNDVHDAGAAGGRIAILTCGPGGMADEARAAVHTALKQGKRAVEYIEETFG